MDDQQVAEVTSLADLIDQLRMVFQSDCVNVDYVSALLAAYKSNPKDWKQYTIFDPHRYGNESTHTDLIEVCYVKRNTHRRRRRDSTVELTVELSRVGGVYAEFPTSSRVDCRRIRSTY